jgi:hypothetical protein
MRLWSPRREKSVTHRRYVGTYAAATGKVTEGAPTETACGCIVAAYEQGMIDGTLIRLGDQRLLFAAPRLAVTPEPPKSLANGSKQRDAVLIGAEEWRVIDVQTHYVGEVAQIHEVQVRR